MGSTTAVPAGIPSTAPASTASGHTPVTLSPYRHDRPGSGPYAARPVHAAAMAAVSQ